jgi:hypothetical protein
VRESGVTWPPGSMAQSRRFSYYRRLSAADQRTYRKSDAVTKVELTGVPAMRSLTEALRGALASGKRRDVERSAQALCAGITEDLGVPPVAIRVRSVRPADRTGELHGLYTWEHGKRPLIEVWMRTAKNENVVAFRTFLRTLLHEVCHHLDFTLLELSETFHTEGFFRRESSLVRQLAGSRQRRGPQTSSEGLEKPPRKRRVHSSSPQLKLFE